MGYSSWWFTQIGLTSAIETQAKGGAGVTIALIDTGVIASHPELSGRVSVLSSCAAVEWSCPNGVVDDNGHGTATASIAAGAYGAPGTLMSGVAPAATVLAEKVLGADGTGYDTDVANGIVKAADAGAHVISLSLTYLPTDSVVSAINYATAKGAVIVWAGGNAASPLNGGANSTGLSTAALSRLIIVGSVDANNTISYFSNRPGTASVVATSGASASYASLWLMAPGEGIMAPAIQYGSGVYATWSGTSMSTPEVAGAVALLEATWPILRTNGTAAALLLASATDLGAAGTDATYGRGLLNLTRAFDPVGPLSTLGVNGASSPAGSGGGVVATGAVGSLSALRQQLASYTVFDAFQRNFTANLSGMVAVAGVSANAQPALATPTRTLTAPVAGGRLTLVGGAAPSFADGAVGEGGIYGVEGRLQGRRDRSVRYLEFAGDGGVYAAIGHGVPSVMSFARAAWGADSAAAAQVGDLGVSTAIASLAQGGDSVAAASAFGRLRVAAAWSTSPAPFGSALASDRFGSSAAAVNLAATFRLTPRWTLGATLSRLDEANALLGTTYSGAGPLSLGARHRSGQVGVTSALTLGGGRSLVAEAALADSDGATMTSGLISRVSPLRARAFGVSFLQDGAFRPGDRLSVSVKKPLRVVSGTASLAVTSVDEDGRPVTTFTPVSLRPSGDETDITLGYAAPIGRLASWRASASLRQDADQVAGRTAVGLRFGLSVAF